MKLVLAIKPKRQTDSRAVTKSHVAKAQAALKLFRPWPDENQQQEIRWIPADMSCALLLVSNEERSVPERDGWESNRQGAIAWTGIIGTSLRKSINGFSGMNPFLLEEARDSSGNFAFVGATMNGIFGITCSSRSEGLYWSETSDAYLISNSAAWLNLIACDGIPQYDLLGIAGFLAHGLPFTDTTVFSGVHVVPCGTHFAIDQNDQVLADTDTGPTNGHHGDAAEKIAAGLVDYAQLLTRDSGRVIAAITGGKDSRLVVSALKAAGVNFSMYTNGLPESGECYIGQQISAATGIAHKINEPRVVSLPQGPQVVQANPEYQVWNTLRSTGGIGSGFTALPPVEKAFNAVSSLANLGGQGGEIIRGGWLRVTGTDVPSYSQTAQILHKTLLNNIDVFTPFARDSVERELRPFMDSALADPAKTLFDVYVTNRTGRWLSSMRHGESVCSPHSTLLINNNLVRYLRTLPADALHAEKMAFSTMRILAPEIVAIPFFRDRWAFEQKAPNAFFDPAGWDTREPYTAHKSPRASFNWRTSRTPELLNHFKSYILDHSTSPLFEIADRNKVEKMLGGFQYRPPLAWALYSAQMTLTNGWLSPDAPSGSILNVVVPQD